MLIPRQTIPGTDIEVSLLGLGTVKFGRNQGVKYPTAFELPDDDSLQNLLAKACSLGINFLDTAPAYGISEIRVGSLLKGQREKWVLATKTGEEFVNGQSSFDFSAKHTIVSVERSLKRLKTDYLDLVLVHSNGNDLDVIHKTDVLATLATLKESGKIRAFGFSGKSVEGGIEALKYCNVAMVTYNLSETTEAAVIEYAKSHGKGIFIKKALASGHVTAKPGQDPVTESFRHILAQQGVSSIIIGTINPDHLKSNAASLQAALKSL